MQTKLQPGQILARGMSRALKAHNFQSILEFVPARGLRVDILAIGAKGEIWIVECKSSRADFQSDNKWQGYLEWCDRFFWCVDQSFPTELLPNDTGLMIADGYDGEIMTLGPEVKLSAARRKAITLSAYRTAALRLSALTDPRPSAGDALADTSEANGT